MNGAWGDDPWGRFAFRWYTQLGWTEHVSDGTNEYLDPPGAHTGAAAPAMAMAGASTASAAGTATVGTVTAGTATGGTTTAGSASVWAERPASARTESLRREPTAMPVSSSQARRDTTAARRWPLIALGMVGSFALGGFVFGRGDGSNESSSVAEEITETSAVVDSTPATAAVTVPETVPPTVLETVPPTSVAAPATLTAEQLATRNDRVIDDAEWPLVSTLLTQFGWAVPTRDEMLVYGTRGCDLAVAASTMSDFEASLIEPMSTSGRAPGEFGGLVGAGMGAMCVDSLIKLGALPPL